MPVEEHCRFYLRAAGIVDSWPQLKNLQERHGFPLGKLVGVNSRIFPVAGVNDFLANCPSEASPLAKQRGEKLQKIMRVKRAAGWAPRRKAELPDQAA